MIRRLAVAVMALGLSAGPLLAQGGQRPRRNPPPPAGGPMPGGAPMPGDTMSPDPMDGMDQQGPGGPRAQMLRMQVEERFGRMVQTDLQLNEQDMQRIRQAMRANQDRHIALMRREQDLRRAIGNQMQPGQAADNDSVARMTDAISHLRIERAQSDDQLVRDLAFLPPVKRARLLFMMQRFQERVQEIRQRSMMGARRGMMMPDRQ